jgi:hypothetical protein
MKPADAKKLLADALLLIDDALKAKSDYWPGVEYKAILVRERAKFETDPALIKSLLAESDRLRAQAAAGHKK